MDTYSFAYICIFYFLFCCSLFRRLKTMAIEMELVQKSEKEKRIQGSTKREREKKNLGTNGKHEKRR